MTLMGLVKMSTISKKERKSDVARRAWNVLRLALLWSRKGGVLRRRLMTDLRLFPKFVRSLANDNDVTLRQRSRYGERQMSFDDTPVFPNAIKINGSSSNSSSMRFLHIPCLNPPPVVDFDYDFDDNDNDVVYESDDQEENIDSRAEEFIATFYEQIKMQRQISYLEYN